MNVLRPLTFGELLDRAVTIAVRDGRKFALVGLVFTVPATALVYRANAVAAGALFTMATNGTPTPTHYSAFEYAGIFVASLLYTLQCTVTIALASDLQAGNDGAYKRIFARGIAAVPRVFAAFLISGLCLLGAGVALFLIVLFFSMLGDASGIVGVFIGLAVCVPVLAFPFLLIELAVVGIVSEGAGLRDSLARAWRRLTSIGRLGRALAVNFVAYFMYFAIYYSAFLLGIFSEDFDHTGIIVNAMLAIGNLLASALALTYLTAFVQDLRIRSEGYDLAVAATELGAPPSGRAEVDAPLAGSVATASPYGPPPFAPGPPYYGRPPRPGTYAQPSVSATAPWNGYPAGYGAQAFGTSPAGQPPFERIDAPPAPNARSATNDVPTKYGRSSFSPPE